MRQINYSLVNARKAPNAIYKARGGSTGYRWGTAATMVPQVSSHNSQNQMKDWHAQNKM